uniref:Uncharacterized protein n=1 Tax=Schistosoma haematobium TaxID=6185 RepID=A0A094ZML0_SCHHA
MLFTDMKSNNNEEKCNQFKTFPEEVIYDFAVRNVDELISLAKRIGVSCKLTFNEPQSLIPEYLLFYPKRFKKLCQKFQPPV